MNLTHIANPVRVTARQIKAFTQSPSGFELHFDDGGPTYFPTSEQLARITVQPGDYLVRQEDGYEYLNPKDVFERKYRVIGAEMAAADKPKDSTATFRSRASEDELRATALNYASRHYDDGSDQVVKAAEAYYQFLKGAA